MRWGEAEPDTIKVEIGGWLVVIYGHNLEAVCRAIEKQTLLRIAAHAEFEVISSNARNCRHSRKDSALGGIQSVARTQENRFGEARRGSELGSLLGRPRAIEFPDGRL